MPPVIHIFALYSDLTKIIFLKESAEQCGINLTLIFIPKWKGYADKITTMKRVICDVPDNNDIICFIDAYDVLVFSDETEIVEKFLSFNCNLVISSELNCYPEKYKKQYDEIIYKPNDDETDKPIQKVSTQFKYVNSGGYIGYKHAIYDLLYWKEEEEMRIICQEGGDQNYVTEYFLEHMKDSKCCLDMKQRIFQSFYKVEFGEFEMIRGRIHNKILNEYPCFSHFNGFNFYQNQICHIPTNKNENIMEVFVGLFLQSREKMDTIIEIPYRVPYHIIYNGVVQGNLPQV
jgi:hypothetical protein